MALHNKTGVSFLLSLLSICACAVFSGHELPAYFALQSYDFSFDELIHDHRILVNETDIQIEWKDFKFRINDDMWLDWNDDNDWDEISYSRSLSSVNSKPDDSGDIVVVDTAQNNSSRRLIEEALELEAEYTRWNKWDHSTEHHKKGGTRFIGESKYRRRFRDARAMCREYYAELASIRNAAENEMVQKLCKKLGRGSCWIGLKMAKKKNWGDTKKWLDRHPLGYTNWAPNEPNNAGGKEKCVEMRGNGQWNDLPCNRRRFAVCEEVTSHRVGEFIGVYKPANWFKANLYCKMKYGTELATIQNKWQQQYAQEACSSAGDEFESKDCWIGLRKKDNVLWEWQDHSVFGGYPNWGLGMPKEAERRKCGYMVNKDKSKNSVWANAECKRSQWFVCNAEERTPAIRMRDALAPPSWNDIQQNMQMMKEQQKVEMAEKKDEQQIYDILHRRHQPQTGEDRKELKMAEHVRSGNGYTHPFSHVGNHDTYGLNFGSETNAELGFMRHPHLGIHASHGFGSMPGEVPFGQHSHHSSNDYGKHFGRDSETKAELGFLSNGHSHSYASPLLSSETNSELQFMQHPQLQNIRGENQFGTHPSSNGFGGGPDSETNAELAFLQHRDPQSPNVHMPMSGDIPFGERMNWQHAEPVGSDSETKSELEFVTKTHPQFKNDKLTTLRREIDALHTQLLHPQFTNDKLTTLQREIDALHTQLLHHQAAQQQQHVKENEKEREMMTQSDQPPSDLDHMNWQHAEHVGSDSETKSELGFVTNTHPQFKNDKLTTLQSEIDALHTQLLHRQAEREQQQQQVKENVAEQKEEEREMMTQSDQPPSDLDHMANDLLQLDSRNPTAKDAYFGTSGYDPRRDPYFGAWNLHHMKKSITDLHHTLRHLHEKKQKLHAEGRQQKEPRIDGPPSGDPNDPYGFNHALQFGGAPFASSAHERRVLLEEEKDDARLIVETEKCVFLKNGKLCVEYDAKREKVTLDVAMPQSNDERSVDSSPRPQYFDAMDTLFEFNPYKTTQQLCKYAIGETTMNVCLEKMENGDILLFAVSDNGTDALRLNLEEDNEWNEIYPDTDRKCKFLDQVKICLMPIVDLMDYLVEIKIIHVVAP